MIVACALLLGTAGAALVYLSHPQQNVLRHVLPAAARAAGLLLMTASTTLWCWSSGIAAGITSALTCSMCAWVALPYAAWWVRGASIKAGRR